MNDNYVSNLSRLGLTPYSAAKHLGVSIRQSMRYAAGTQPISAPVALLIEAYLRHGETLRDWISRETDSHTEPQ
jgi:plasmid maintenance system antidote protein VapI